jgi:hypothetical protein
MHGTGGLLAWAAFLAGILALLALDLGLFHRRDRALPAREALGWVVVWVALAFLFAGGVAWRSGGVTALDFVTGYLIELSLSVDNLFVFVLVFATFRIPPALQHRVLFWGIVTALVLRGAMILGGAALLERFGWLVYVFGGFLVVTGAKLLWERDAPHAPEQTGTASSSGSTGAASRRRSSSPSRSSRSRTSSSRSTPSRRCSRSRSIRSWSSPRTCSPSWGSARCTSPWRASSAGSST